MSHYGILSLSNIHTHRLTSPCSLGNYNQKKKKPINYKNKYQNSITTVALSQNLFANKLLDRVKQTWSNPADKTGITAVTCMFTEITCMKNIDDSTSIYIFHSKLMHNFFVSQSSKFNLSKTLDLYRNCKVESVIKQASNDIEHLMANHCFTLEQFLITF